MCTRWQPCPQFLPFSQNSPPSFYCFNRGFYCRSYCLLNIFQAPLCPSAEGYVSGLQDASKHPANRTHNPQLHTRPATWKPQHEIPQAATTVKHSWSPDDGHSGARNMLMCPVCRMPASILQTGHTTLSSPPDQQLENHSTKYHRQEPLYNTLELLMMGIVVPETCWASNKICNKNLCCI